MLDPILAADAVIMPYKGILKACAMSLPVSISLVQLSFFCPPNELFIDIQQTRIYGEAGALLRKSKALIIQL